VLLIVSVQLTTNSARIVLGAECGCPLVESDAVAVAVAGVDVAVRARHDNDDGYMVRTINDTISSKLGRSTTRYRQAIDDYCRCDACWICGAQE